ncbi:YsnF/AvaK domain-containing protein [Pseudocnuella soli]|uniref:YsnF/AvaK domain-containing protein n=1 Tax=Pseudocnuella soli TaxID=2502779 RepID=UPI00104F58A9|nr:YsnF/AvaK domain-containing protein [Pseudocnuella soli]
MAQTVIGFFDNRNEAERAVAQLQSAGISRDRIDISSGRDSSTTGVSYTDTDRDRDHESGITRFFRNLFGGDDDEATRYSRVANTSDCVVTVHAQSDSEAERAADLLDEYGAIDVDERSSRLNASGTGSDYSERGDFRGDRDQTIPVIREDLNVGKRSEETGGVRVRSRIVERPVEEHVRLREEHVRVDRNPVDRPVGTGEMGAFREGEIELTERAEVPVVNKEARVVEEVRLSKETTERDETIRDTVRRTDVDVEQLGDRSRSTDRSDRDYTDRSDVSLNDNSLLRDNDLRGSDYRDTDKDLRDNLRDNTNRSL